MIRILLTTYLCLFLLSAFAQQSPIYTFDGDDFSSVSTMNGQVTTIATSPNWEIEMNASTFNAIDQQLIFISNDVDSLYIIDVMDGSDVYKESFSLNDGNDLIIEYCNATAFLYTVEQSQGPLPQLMYIDPIMEDEDSIASLPNFTFELDASTFDQANQHLIIATNDIDSVYAVDVTTGAIAYKYAYPFSNGNEVLIEYSEADELIYTFNQATSTIESISPTDGSITSIGTLSVSGAELQYSSFDHAANQMVIGTSDGDLIYGIDVSTASIAYSYSFDFPGGDDFILESGGASTTDLEEDLPQISFSLFPNPSSEWLHISLSNKVHPANLSIYDVQGKIMATHRVLTGQDEIKVDVSSLQAGLYFVRLDEEFAGKFLVK